jgi:hypothetical protein
VPSGCLSPLKSWTLARHSSFRARAKLWMAHDFMGSDDIVRCGGNGRNGNGTIRSLWVSQLCSLTTSYLIVAGHIVYSCHPSRGGFVLLLSD